jgi:hypothetical protein
MDARSNPEESRPRRRSGPRLWWLLVLVLVCAVGFGWWAQVERQQRRAVEVALERLAAERAYQTAVVERVRADLLARSVAAQPQPPGGAPGQDANDQQIQALKDQIADLEAKLKALEARAKP